MTRSSLTSQYKIGDVVPFHFSPGIFVASAVVSLLGCVVTVELLHRKKGGKGWITWLHQLGISVSLGLVGIWCMHYIGNRAIILGDGSLELQLAYNAGYTSLSVLLPIVILFLGLTLGEFLVTNHKTVWSFLIVGGIVVGLSITGMHYIGNLGISNYRLINSPAYIVGAAAIAVGVSIGALSLFFYLKAKWIHSWPKRLAIAVLLACTVSGMHWLATVGTTYILIEIKSDEETRDVNLIVATVCGLISCVVCIAFIFLTKIRKQKLADRAQHVVLASATFDSEGRLLVTQEGLLPCRKVTKQFNQKSFDDEFNIAHPVFQWLYRVTFNWSGVSDLVPGMRSHLRAVGIMKDRHSLPSTVDTGSPSDDGDVEGDYSVIFREYFCVAADELAATLDIPLNDLGVLYNGILTTGSYGAEFTRKKNVLGRMRRSGDIESGALYPGMFGRGQLLFVVRSVDKIEALRLKSAGYRFANVGNITEILARAMRAPHADVVDTMDRLRLYAQPPTKDNSTGATYLACFAIRASIKTAHRNWEILVPTKQPNELPMVELGHGPLLPWQLERLSKLDGLSVSQSIGYLNNIASECGIDNEKEFTEHLLDQITNLTHQVPEDFFQRAIFCAQPVVAPSLGEERHGLKPQIFAFCIIPDVHGASVKSTAVTYMPLSFFQCIQRVYKRSPDHAILAQRIHREFGAILAHKDVAVFSQNRSSQRLAGLDRRLSAKISMPSVPGFSSRDRSPRGTSPSPGQDFADLSDSKVSHTTRSSKSSTAIDKDGGDWRRSLTAAAAPVAFGGIMVSSNTKVEVHTKTSNTVELEDMGTRAEVGVAANEAPTYVDDLFKIASARWHLHK